MSKIKNYTIGADIELFLMEKATNTIVSAEGIIQGTKRSPFFFDPNDKFAATSLDNVLAEYCIAPARNSEDFVKNINKSIGYINSILPPELCTAALPCAVLDEKYLQTKNAKLFGCESDYNAWLKCQNPKPKADNQNLRSAGTHVHIGYEDPSLAVTEEAVKAMDLFLSVPSVLIEPDNERRKLYGKAGAFRIKPYGFEHRVLSGFFGGSDELKRWVFENTELAIQFVNDNRADELESVSDLIQMAINNSDKVLAGNLIRQFEIPTL